MSAATADAEKVQFGVFWVSGGGITVKVNHPLTPPEARKLAVMLLTSADKVEEEQSK